MSNVAVLNGSPRRKGNTAALCEAFADGAREAGNSVEVLHLEGLGIHGCKGCCCGDNLRENPCVQRDGMIEVYRAVRASDVVVLASPLYYWMVSGQLRCAIDRLYALEEGDENLLRGHGRASALLMAAQGHAFEAATQYFDCLCERLRWQNLGHVLAGGNLNAGDIAGKPELAQARRLGASIG